MNREELKAKLDVDKNGKVNFEDVVSLSGGYNKKLVIGVSCLVGAICFVLGALVF